MFRSKLRAPVNITWEITLRCNFHCRHCLSDAGTEMIDELSFQESVRLIDQLSSLKVFQVNIGGGEPFIREDFMAILTHAHARGLVTCVSTNGSFIDDRLARSLSRMKLLYLQVSLDGASSEVNDAIRGGGTYERIIDSIGCLARHKVPFSINTVLTRSNFSQLEKLREMARGYGGELRVSRFRPSGRGKECRKSLGPHKEQLEAFADWLNENALVRTGDSFFCLTSENRRRKGLDMCGAGKMTCCISPAGNVYPCAFLQEEAFLVGNVREVGLQDLWDYSPVLNELRHLNVKSCEACSRFDSCRGGCPAMAYHTYDDITLPDPECLMNLRRLPS